VLRRQAKRALRNVKDKVWRTLERLLRFGHRTNPSGNNQSQR